MHECPRLWKKKPPWIFFLIIFFSVGCSHATLCSESVTEMKKCKMKDYTLKAIMPVSITRAGAFCTWHLTEEWPSNGDGCFCLFTVSSRTKRKQIFLEGGGISIVREDCHSHYALLLGNKMNLDCGFRWILWGTDHLFLLYWDSGPWLRLPENIKGGINQKQILSCMKRSCCRGVEREPDY